MTIQEIKAKYEKVSDRLPSEHFYPHPVTDYGRWGIVVTDDQELTFDWYPVEAGYQYVIDNEDE